MIIDFVHFSIADLLPLAIRNIPEMRLAAILEVLFEALDSRLSFNNTRIGELESRLALKNSEFDAATD